MSPAYKYLLQTQMADITGKNCSTQSKKNQGCSPGCRPLVGDAGAPTLCVTMPINPYYLIMLTVARRPLTRSPMHTPGVDLPLVATRTVRACAGHWLLVAFIREDILSGQDRVTMLWRNFWKCQTRFDCCCFRLPFPKSLPTVTNFCSFILNFILYFS